MTVTTIPEQPTTLIINGHLIEYDYTKASWMVKGQHFANRVDAIIHAYKN